MNRSKKLSILLGVLAVACIATFGVLRMEEQKEQIKNSGEIILELPVDSVQALSWNYNGTALSFHKSEETWLYDKDAAFPVSAERIAGLLEQFQSFGAAFIIEDVEDAGQYGLDQPVCTISLSAEEQTYEIKLGDYSKMDSQRYVSIGDGNVYLVKHDPLDEFKAELKDMIDNDKTPAFAQVTKIQFTGEENDPIIYEENGSDSDYPDDVYFIRRGGETLPLDTSKVNSYLQAIQSLQLTDYVSYNASDEELRSCGLDSPDLTVTVDYTAEDERGNEAQNPFVLHISRDPEEKTAAEKVGEREEQEDEEETVTAYARIGDSKIIYRLSSDSYQKLIAASYDDFRHREVFWADFADIRQIDISLEGSEYSIQSEKKGKERIYLYQEEETDLQAFQKALENLNADSFTSEKPTQREEIRLTIYLDRENFPEVSIVLYRYDGTHCLAEVNGQPVSLVERSGAVDLIEAVHAIVLN